MENDFNFGKNLVKLRKLTGLTQVQLAVIIDVSQRMLSHYETKADSIPVCIFPKLATALKIDICELFTTHKQPHKSDQLLAKVNPRTLDKIKKLLAIPSQDRGTVYTMIDGYYNYKLLKKQERNKDAGEQ